MSNKEQRVEPRTLPGFMELLPADQILFNHMVETIKTTYENFGFVPLDTPVIELSEVLLAKAGGETEKQIYSFIKGDNNLTLRFDLTVPLAKYVAKYYHELTFPFRRYHIGKVFRGERPQKGRFREFYQCDIDIIGDGELSVINDAEIPSIIYNTFTKLGFDNFTIRINNRKVLNGFFTHLDIGAQAADVMRIIDKLEKIGHPAVEHELKNLGLDERKTAEIMGFIGIQGANDEICQQLSGMKIDNPMFVVGVDELKQVVENIGHFGVPSANTAIDLTIARGLDYYTGTVYETILNDYPQIGSVCSGGRYDNLAEYFTDKKLPGVGISIGLTRLFYQLHQAGVIQSGSASPAKVLIIPMNVEMSHTLQLAAMLRNREVNTEIFLEKKSMKAKFSYANKQKIPYVIIIGEDEIKHHTVTLKKMDSGEQTSVPFDQIVAEIVL